jgi:glycosyltransferase involved in cell wall biosynthesis
LAGETASRTRLNVYYNRADLFVLATEYEGYGMAVAEAIASGLPVISTRTGAIPQLVGRDAGILVRRGDVDMLARVLERVLRERRLLADLRAGAIKRRAQLPSWEQAVRKFAGVIRKVAKP